MNKVIETPTVVKLPSLTDSKEVRVKIESIKDALNQTMIERDEAINMAILALLTNQSLFMVGPPGVGKSLLARSLTKLIGNAKHFDYLITRHSVPDEIFGPVSVKDLTTNDRYSRKIKDYMPDSNIVFLDEIFKGSPAILNSLLTIVNEKIFKNGDEVVKVPLKLLIAASNEIPTQSDGLDALYDRFVIRTFVNNISDSSFVDYLDRVGNKERRADLDSVIDIADLDAFHNGVDKVRLSKGNMVLLLKVRQAVEKHNHNCIINQDAKNIIPVSDRRFEKICSIMKANAFANGREETIIADAANIWNCLWHKPHHIAIVKAILFDEIKKAISLGGNDGEALIHNSQDILRDIKRSANIASEVDVDSSSIENSKIPMAFVKLDIQGNKNPDISWFIPLDVESRLKLLYQSELNDDSDIVDQRRNIIHDLFNESNKFSSSLEEIERRAQEAFTPFYVYDSLNISKANKIKVYGNYHTLTPGNEDLELLQLLPIYDHEKMAKDMGVTVLLQCRVDNHVYSSQLVEGDTVDADSVSKWKAQLKGLLNQVSLIKEAIPSQKKYCLTNSILLSHEEKKVLAESFDSASVGLDSTEVKIQEVMSALPK